MDNSIEISSILEQYPVAAILPISDIHLQDIAQTCSLQCRYLANHLKMKNQRIWNENPDEQGRRYEFLAEWKSEKGDGANYLTLIGALLSIKCKDDADYVKSLMKDVLPPPAASSDVLPPPDATSDVLPPPDATSDVLPPPDATSDVLPPPDATLDVLPPPANTSLPAATLDVLVSPTATSDVLLPPDAAFNVLPATSDASMPLAASSNVLPPLDATSDVLVPADATSDASMPLAASSDILPSPDATSNVLLPPDATSDVSPPPATAYNVSLPPAAISDVFIPPAATSAGLPPSVATSDASLPPTATSDASPPPDATSNVLPPTDTTSDVLQPPAITSDASMPLAASSDASDVLVPPAARSVSSTAPLPSNVVHYLMQLGNSELIKVGVSLGLSYARLTRYASNTLLNDLVNAWLLRYDNVIFASGEPSWNTLYKALTDNGFTGIATDIRNGPLQKGVKRRHSNNYDESASITPKKPRGEMLGESAAWVVTEEDTGKPSKRKHSESACQVEKRPKVDEGGQLLSAGKVLLQTASNGLALRGVFYTTNIEDQLEVKNRILEVPESPAITGCFSCEKNKRKFYSSKQENEFKKQIDVLGYSAATSALHGPADDSNPLSASLHTSGIFQNNENVTYSSVAEYSTVHLASYFIGKQEMKLSNSAINDLKDVTKILGNNSGHIRQACKHFFDKFGSHVYMGPLKFGGHFWSLCSIIKDESQSDIILSGDFKDSSMETHQIKTTGGPTTAIDFDQWKIGLVANVHTWALTDRGTKLLAVWDIIRENHANELGVLQKYLKDAWEDLTGLVADKDKLSYIPEIVLKNVSEWNEDSLTTWQLNDCFSYLQKVKDDIFQTTENRRIWIDDYLSQPPLQQFLLAAIRLHIEPQKTKLLMKKIVEQEDIDLILSKSLFHANNIVEIINDFLYKPPLSKIENSINDFKSFVKYLETIVSDVTLNSQTLLIDAGVLPKEVYVEITQAVNHLKYCCSQKLEAILLAILIHLFESSHYDGLITLKVMTLNDLHDMIKLFTKKSSEFYQCAQDGNPLHYQAYLFLMATDLCQDSNHLNSFLLKIKDMMEAVSPLQPELEDIVTTYSSVNSLKVHLQSLLTSKSHQLFERNASSLNVLQTKPHQYLPSLSRNLSFLFKQNSAAHALLDSLGLCDYYPKGLQLKDALCIRLTPLKQSLGKFNLHDKKYLPNLFLHKLMAYDCQCRSDLMHSVKIEADDNSSISSDSEEESEEASEDGIHPVDTLLSIIVCSSDILRQDLFSRLAKCQLAVPFIIPDPFTKQLTVPLWALRLITKDIGIDEREKMSHVIVEHKMPIVSFLRIGKRTKGSKSKSHILNYVISGSVHNQFFHYDCSGAQHDLVLGQGLVDMAWYIPAGRPNEIPFPVTFLNLHGDARDYQQQSSFLCKISSMYFILQSEDAEVDTETVQILKQFSDVSLGGIALLSETESTSKQLKKESIKFYNIDISKKNMPQIISSVHNRIKKKLCGHESNFQSIAYSCHHFKSEEIIIDEESDPSLKQAIQFATSVKSEFISDKSSMLPLQGMWQSWAKQDKEVHRQKYKSIDTSVNKYSAMIEAEKKKIRKEQIEEAKLLSPLMQIFIQSMLKLSGPSNRVLRYQFLRSLQMELNIETIGKVSKQQSLYHLKRKELNKLQKTSNAKKEDEKKEKDEDECKKRMKEIQNEIAEASLGLEHIFREIGQIYEAAQLTKEIKSDLSCLPKLAAELLIDGYSLELIDGDSSHVPLTWITAVFDEMVKILKNPNVYILSVLGLQSSGKSTMLNTVFGLQFNVSAGRCTHGAFMRLLPVDEELSKQSGISYVLVIDTEGLRAPELDPTTSQEHDNELATFVIGLANATLINIKGEVPADIDNILQTSVHAFLRMRHVYKFKPSCQFVHQSAESSKNNEVGQSKFMQKLNDLTVLAAEQEGLQGQYDYFNDVIDFDDLNDEYYFKGLWTGDPPMASVNYGYSESAQKWKLRFIESLCDSRTRKDCRLSLFHTKLCDLWKALLQEDFIFSFKSTVEVNAYTTLEKAYSKLERTFRAEVLDWFTVAENEISSTAADTQSICDLVEKKLQELKFFVPNLYKKLNSDLVNFFHGDQREILVQWKETFEIRLREVSRDLLNNAERHCITLQESKVAILRVEKKRVSYKNMVTKKVQDDIKTIKNDNVSFAEALQEGSLTPAQLREFRAKLSSENLERCKEHNLITEGEVTQIKRLERLGKAQSDDDIKNIISELGRVSTQKIYERGPTEEQLKKKFDMLWLEVIRQIPNETRDYYINIELEVERELLRFVKRSDPLIPLLEGRSLRDWGVCLSVIPEEGIHYNFKAGSLFQKSWDYLRSKKPNRHLPDRAAATILSNAKQNLSEMTGKDTDFKTGLVYKLLVDLDEDMKKELTKVKEIEFTRHFRNEIYLTVCGHSISKFERMSDSFLERHNPRHHLERFVKKPLFIEYKSQIYQIEAEEAIASKLCACLEEPIQEQLHKTVVKNIVQMLRSEQHFSSKMALKVKILKDLRQRDRFEDYVAYIKDVRTALVAWLMQYVVQYCDKESDDGGTKLQVRMKTEVSRLIGVVENEVNAVNETDANKCLLAFCDNAKLRSELGVNLKVGDLRTGYDSLKEIVLDNFKSKVRSGLQQITERSHLSISQITCEDKISAWKDELLQLLGDIIGCTAQCPFCNEQCDYLNPNHVTSDVKHSTAVHRPNCLATYRRITDNVMITDICPAQVASKTQRFRNGATKQVLHLYKKYQEIYPDWSINPDLTAEQSLYWKSFVARYMKELAKEFKAEPGEVPSEWMEITIEEITENLNDLYKC